MNRITFPRNLLLRYASAKMLGLVLMAILIGIGAGPVLAKDTPDPWKKAAELLATGKPREALDIYSKLISQKPEDPRGYVGRGRTLWQLNDLDGAIAAFDRALALAPKDAKTYNDRGLAFHGKGLLDRALRDFDRAIELSSASASFHFNRAATWILSNDPSKALADYNKAIELNPKFALAYARRGNLLLPPSPPRVNPGRSAPGDASDHVYRGRRAVPLHPIEKNFDKAMADFAKAIELNPQSPLAYGFRAEAWLARGDYDKALADSSRSLELNPDEAKMLRIRSATRRALGDEKGADEDSQRALILERQPTPNVNPL